MGSYWRSWDGGRAKALEWTAQVLHKPQLAYTFLK